MTADLAERVYPEIAYGGYSRVDGTVAFYSRIQALMPPHAQVLDVGCGRGKDALDRCEFRRQLTDLRRPGRQVTGIDVDAAGTENPIIDAFQLIEDVDHWPVPDSAYDVVVANSVLEHVERPAQFFSEAWRTLRPGGYLCFRTYNRWGYVGLCARLIPNRHHSKVTSYAQEERDHQDVFPTLYRCNTPRAIKRALRTQGFRYFVYSIEAEPSYLRFSPILYRAGAIAHRLIPPSLRWSIMAFAQKPQ